MQLDPVMFTLGRPRVQLSDEVLVAALRGFAERNQGRPFTMEQFNEWRERPCAALTISMRFGSWRKALLKVGLRALHGFDYEPEELIEELERVWRRLGHAPGKKLLARHGSIPACVYERRWGSLHEVCRRLALYHAGSLARDQLLKAVAKQTGRAKVPLSQRWRIMDRDGRRCRVCGRGAPRYGKLTLHVDHIVPVSRGGTNDDENLRVLCSECNLGRSDSAAA
jgi:hypothetical protein